VAVSGIRDANFWKLADRDLPADASEAVLVSPALQTCRADLDEQPTSIGELVELAFGLGVVDPGRGKGVVAESHVVFSRPIYGPSKWRNLEDFPPLYPPYSPPKWRDFVVGRETS